MEKSHQSLPCFIFICVLLVNPVSSIYNRRPDPLRSFKLYEGGYDLQSRHYWAATVFTGVHGYAVVGAWIAGGAGLLVFFVASKKKMRYSSGSERNSTSFSSSSCSRSPRNLVLVLMILFSTLIAIGSSVVFLVKIHGLHGSAREVEEKLLGAAGTTCHSLRRVVRAVKELSKILEPHSSTALLALSSFAMDLTAKLKTIRADMRKDRHLFDTVLAVLYGATLGTVSINLAFVLATIVVLLRCWHPGLIMVIIVCWISTGICWALTGFHFVLLVFTEDTCSAMVEFKQNPSNSSIALLLPCPTPSEADSIVAEFDFAIDKITSQLGLEEKQVDLKICDPFSNPPRYNYDPRTFSNGNTTIDHLTRALESKEPYLSGGIHCTIPNDKFIQHLKTSLSDLRRLINCSYMKVALNHVFRFQCEPLRTNTRALWSSMLALSISMVVLEVALIVKALQNRRNRLSLNCMVHEQV